MSIPTHESTQWQGGSWNPGPPWTSQVRVSSAPQGPPARRASRAHYCPLQSFPPQDSQSHPTELPLDLAIPTSIESHPLGVKSSPSRTVRTLLPSQPPPSVTGSTALGSPQQLRPRTFPPPGKLSSALQAWLLASCHLLGAALSDHHPPLPLHHLPSQPLVCRGP